MKIPLHTSATTARPFGRRARERGSVLVITLGLGLLLGITLGGYLYWVRTQNLLVAQSQAWNAALALAEAGVEEGMAQANAVFGTNYLPSIATNWGSSASVSAGGGAPVFGPRTGALLNGSYSAILIANSPGPTIVSTGYASVPMLGIPVSRTVQVTTACYSPFGNAVTVRSNLTLKGSGLTIDSYDSSDPNHSTNGLYDASTRKAGGDVNSVEGLVSVQNASIYGHVRTGANGSIDIGNGSVGDLAWNVKGQIEPGWYANDYNADFKDVKPPYSAGMTITPTVIKGTNTFYFIGTGQYYQEGDFVMSQNETMYVNGVATIYVTGNFNMKSQNACSIVIAPGGKLTLIVGTTDGPPVFSALTQVNTAGNAYTFQYFGLPSNATVTWTGNTTYMGTIYAPEADFTLGGGGSDIMDYQGACVAKSGTLNGHFNIHYDENLKRIGMPTGYVVTSWREL